MGGNGLAAKGADALTDFSAKPKLLLSPLPSESTGDHSRRSHDARHTDALRSTEEPEGEGSEDAAHANEPEVAAHPRRIGLRGTAVKKASHALRSSCCALPELFGRARSLGSFAGLSGLPLLNDCIELLLGVLQRHVGPPEGAPLAVRRHGLVCRSERAVRPQFLLHDLDDDDLVVVVLGIRADLDESNAAFAANDGAGKAVTVESGGEGSHDMEIRTHTSGRRITVGTMALRGGADCRRTGAGAVDVEVGAAGRNSSDARIALLNAVRKALMEKARPRLARKPGSLVPQTKTAGFGYGWSLPSLLFPNAVPHDSAEDGFGALPVLRTHRPVCRARVHTSGERQLNDQVGLASPGHFRNH